MNKQAQQTAGIPWYRPDQWELLKAFAEDADQLDDTYDAWLRSAGTMLEQFQTKGISAVRVDIDVRDLIRWCEQQRIPVNGSSRAQYVSLNAPRPRK